MNMKENNKIPFNKPPKTFDELIQQLKDRGMIIGNEDFAKDILSKVNYYRLSGYWFKFQNKYINRDMVYSSPQEKEEFENKFSIKITFENIVDIYKFDSKLRSLCFDALEKIEVTINSVICEYMCKKTGDPYWFLDGTNIIPYKNKNKIVSHDDILKKFKEYINNSRNKKTTCLKSFYFKYNNEYPPYWILSQFITFGTLSLVYNMLLPSDKMEIAKKLKLYKDFLENSLHALAYIRNVCAHYARLWDNENSITIANINFYQNNPNSIYNIDFHNVNENNIMVNKNNINFFPVFYTIALFLKNLYPKSKWVSLVSNRIEEYQTKTNSLVSFERMGFPKGWEELPLIKEMLKNVYKV